MSANVTFTPTLGVTTTLSVDTPIAGTVQSALDGFISKVVAANTVYDEVSVQTLNLTGTVSTTLASTPTGLNPANYIEVEGAASGMVALPTFTKGVGGGYSGEIVTDTGSLTLGGVTDPNNLLILAAGSNVTADFTPSGAGQQTILAGGSTSTLNIDGLNQDIILGGGTNTVNINASPSFASNFSAIGVNYSEITTDAGATDTINVNGAQSSVTIMSAGSDVINIASSSGAGAFNNQITVTGHSAINIGTGSSGDQIDLSGTDTMSLAGSGNFVTVSGASTVYASGSNNTIVTSGTLAHIVNTGVGNIIEGPAGQSTGTGSGTGTVSVSGGGAGTSVGSGSPTSGVTLDVGGTIVSFGVASNLLTGVQDLVNSNVNQVETNPNPFVSLTSDSIVSGQTPSAAPSNGKGPGLLYINGTPIGATTNIPAPVSLTGGLQTQYGIVVDATQGASTVVGGAPKNGLFIAAAGANVTYDPQGGTGIARMIGSGGDNFTLDGQAANVSLGGAGNIVTATSVAGGSYNSILTAGGGQDTVNLTGGQDTVTSGGAADRIIAYNTNGDQISVTGAGSFLGMHAGSQNVTASVTGNGDTVSMGGEYETLNGAGMTGKSSAVLMRGTSEQAALGGSGAAFLMKSSHGDTLTSTGATVADFGTGNTVSASNAKIAYEYGTGGKMIGTGVGLLMANGSGNTMVSDTSGVIAGKLTDSTVVASGSANVVLGNPNGQNNVTLSGSGNGLFLGGDSVVASGTGFSDLAAGSNSLSITGANGVAFTGLGQDTIAATGASTVFSGSANVTMKGGASTDFNQGAGSVNFIGGSGSSVVFGGTDGNNVLNGGAGSATLFGAGANNSITGGASGSNLLVAGSGGTDTLLAGGGSTTMVGSGSGGGQVEMTGAANGKNTFEIGAGANLVNAGTGTMPGASNVILAGAQSAGGYTDVLNWSSGGTLDLSGGVTVKYQNPNFFGLGSVVQLSNGASIMFSGFDQKVTTATV